VPFAQPQTNTIACHNVTVDFEPLADKTTSPHSDSQHTDLDRRPLPAFPAEYLPGADTTLLRNTIRSMSRCGVVTD
jgi:hypothetical protein